MKLTITKPALGGSVAAIASKSMAHRCLIAAALSSGSSRVVCAETSDDINATVRCLTALGAQITYENGVFTVVPIERPVQGARTLDCGESGSTLRFMLPVTAALGTDATFIMSGRLPERPLSPLYEELTSHGCAMTAPGHSPLYMSGQLQAGTYSIPGDISSQYISGLLLALPLLAGDSLIKVSGRLESKPYVDMTRDVLTRFGVKIRDAAGNYSVPGQQTLTAPETLTVEGDWSNAAFWLCAGALSREPVTVTNLNRGSIQGDRAVLSALERFGAVVNVEADNVTVSRTELHGIEYDAGDTPDLVPVLAAVAAVADGQTTIYNAGRLRIKESDRLKTVSETLSALGADVQETSDGLVINGKPHLAGGLVSAHGDHRIAMSAAVAACACSAPVTVDGAEAVAKSYPGFWTDYKALGGSVKEES